MTELRFALVACVLACGCYRSHPLDLAADGGSHDAGDDGFTGPEQSCEPGTVEARWVSGWEEESAKTSTTHDGAFYLSYGGSGSGGRIERHEPSGEYTVIATLAPIRQVMRHRFVRVEGVLWFIRWGRTMEARVVSADGPEEDPMWEVSVPRLVKEVEVLDSERLLLLTNGVDEPLRSIVLSTGDGRTLQPQTNVIPDSTAWLEPMPNGPPLLTAWHITPPDAWRFSMRRFGEEAQTVLEMQCEGGISAVNAGECGVSLLSLDGDALALMWRTRTESFLEIREPAAPPLREALPRAPRYSILRGPGDTILRVATQEDELPRFEVLNRTLEVLGTGRLEHDGITLADGEMPRALYTTYFTPTDSGFFQIFVVPHGGSGEDGLTGRRAVGHICPL